MCNNFRTWCITRVCSLMVIKDYRYTRRCYRLMLFPLDIIGCFCYCVPPTYVRLFVCVCVCVKWISTIYFHGLKYYNGVFITKFGFFSSSFDFDCEKRAQSVLTTQKKKNLIFKQQKMDWIYGKCSLQIVSYQFYAKINEQHKKEIREESK